MDLDTFNNLVLDQVTDCMNAGNSKDDILSALMEIVKIVEHTVEDFEDD